MPGFYNSECVQLFKSLTESEIRQLGNFLNNTYRKAGAVYSLYKHLRSCYPKFIETKLDRNYIEQRLYKNNSNPKHTLFEATSDLKKQLVDFITIQELRKNEVHQNFLLLEALKSRKLDRLFFKESERIQKEWDDDSVPGIEHFHNQYKLKLLIFSHPNFDNLKIKLTFENSIDLLEQYYYISKMYYILCYNINYSKESITKYSIQKLVNDYKLTSFPKKLKTKFLFDFLIAFQSNKIESFRIVKSTFFKVHDNFTQSEKHDIFTILKILYFSKRNETNVVKDLFEMTKFSLKENLILEDGIMTSQSFINFIFIAKRNKETKWIENFIKKYKAFLSEKEKEEIVLFAEAILQFEKKEFGNSLKKLSELRPNSVVNRARTNCLKLQCFYELRNEKSFYHLVKSSQKYLLDHKNDFNNQQDFFMFDNFIKNTKKLFGIYSDSKLYGNTVKDRIKQMLEKLYKIKHATYSEWLIDKLNEIQKK